MRTSREFWNKKRVLVTGHTGFKGSWLTFWLSQMGAEVSGLALSPSTQPNGFSALNIESLCASHQILDIRDRSALEKSVARVRPEVVFHMAAQPLVRYSYQEPLETYETNVMGTAYLLNSLRQSTDVRSIVVITTDKCYENRELSRGYTEADPLGGYDPYSSSKACAEILTASFRKSFFGSKPIGVATARAGNVIGGGDWSLDRLIPDLVRSFQTNTPMEIRAPKSVRPWQHVLSPLNGYLTLAEKLFSDPVRYSQAYNFAPEDADCVNVQTIIENFGEAWGTPMPWKLSDGPQPHETTFLKLDANKAKSELGWQPKWNLQKALVATAKWYQCYYNQPKHLVDLTREQIATYQE